LRATLHQFFFDSHLLFEVAVFPPLCGLNHRSLPCFSTEFCSAQRFFRYQIDVLLHHQKVRTLPGRQRVGFASLDVYIVVAAPPTPAFCFTIAILMSRIPRLPLSIA
jgi:hypothetical protein